MLSQVILWIFFWCGFILTKQKTLFLDFFLSLEWFIWNVYGFILQSSSSPPLLPPPSHQQRHHYSTPCEGLFPTHVTVLVHFQWIYFNNRKCTCIQRFLVLDGFNQQWPSFDILLKRRLKKNECTGICWEYEHITQCFTINFLCQFSSVLTYNFIY